MEVSLLRAGVACALTVITIGCNQRAAGTDGTAPESIASQPRAVLTEHHFEPPLSAKDTGKPAGSDCSEHGADSCATRLCVHTTASRNSGYVCSGSCLGDENCPTSWRCAQTYPGGMAGLCVPTTQRAEN